MSSGVKNTITLTSKMGSPCEVSNVHHVPSFRDTLGVASSDRSLHLVITRYTYSFEVLGTCCLIALKYLRYSLPHFADKENGGTVAMLSTPRW